MAKGKGRRGHLPHLSGGGGRRQQQDMLQQLQSLQEDMLEAQEEIASMVVTASAGGGVVKAEVTGEHRVKSITIVPDVVDPEDVEMLQDLVIAAINEGLDQVDEVSSERMSGFTGGLDIPGMPSF